MSCHKAQDPKDFASHYADLFMNTQIVISKLRETRELKISRDRPDLNIFTTLNKGDAFKKKTCWGVNHFDAPTYLISYNNSYPLNVVTGDLEYRPKYVTSSCMCCYISLDISIPDTIIQPLSFAEKIRNILFHQSIKLDSPIFNKKYLLQSTNKDSVKKVLSRELISAIQSYDDLHIEIRSNNCLIYYLQPLSEIDGIVLLNIAEKFGTVNKGSDFTIS